MRSLIGILLIAVTMPALALTHGRHVEDARFSAVREILIRENAESLHVGGCTGTFITKKHFLTAAHCFENLKAKVLFGGIEIGPESQSLSRQTWTPINTPFKVFVNPSFAGSVTSHEAADIAIIEFTYDISVTTMPLANTPAEKGDAVVLSGYGCDKSAKNEKTTFKIGPAVVQQPSEFRVSVAKSKITLCPGDSGGPLMRQRSDGSFEVIGVNSYFNPVSKFLGNSFDRVARVDAAAPPEVLAWIETVTSGQSTQKPVISQGF